MQDGSKTWTAHWLAVLRAEEYYHPKSPALGFGDPHMLDIIQSAVEYTADTGAVRHSAECFNFYFPQVLRHIRKGRSASPSTSRRCCAI